MLGHAARVRNRLVAEYLISVMANTYDGMKAFRDVNLLNCLIECIPSSASLVFDKFSVSNGTRPTGEWIFDHHVGLLEPDPKIWNRRIKSPLRTLLLYRLVGKGSHKPPPR